jgi:RNA polymerase sigma-32 factor
METFKKTIFLTKSQESDLIAKWQEFHEPKYCENLLVAFKPLIFNLVKKYKYYGVTYEDLEQEAWLGICTALEKYDASRGVRFSSYAKLWINAYCQDYVMRNWSIVRIGTTRIHKKLFFQLRYLKSKLEAVETSYLDFKIAKTIAYNLQTTVSEVQFMYDRLIQKDQFLDQRINENFEITFIDMLEDEVDSVEIKLINAEKQSSYEAMQCQFYEFLNEREFDILIKHRVQSPPQTLEEISLHHGLSKERVRQIEKHAVRKLKKAFITFGIRTIADSLI